MRYVSLFVLVTFPALAQILPQAEGPAPRRQAALEQECRRGSQAACREAERIRASLTGPSRESGGAGGGGPPARAESFGLEELTAPPSQRRPGNNVGE